MDQSFPSLEAVNKVLEYVEKLLLETRSETEIVEIAGSGNFDQPGILSHLELPCQLLAKKLIHLAQEKNLFAKHLVQTAKLAEIGLALTEVVHELRQPLAAISGYAQLIEIDALPADARSHLKEVLKQSARMERMLDRLRRFLRVDDQEDLETDVKSAIQGALALFPNMPPGVSLETEIDSNLPSVIGSYHSLVQILTNLLANARDAQANYGPGIIRIQAQWSGQQVSILVADQGAGVDPAIVTKLFEPFVSTKGEMGTGLGLYICREIVCGWKGTLRLVENPPALFCTAFELGLQPVGK